MTTTPVRSIWDSGYPVIPDDDVLSIIPTDTLVRYQQERQWTQQALRDARFRQQQLEDQLMGAELNGAIQKSIQQGMIGKQTPHGESELQQIRKWKKKARQEEIRHLSKKLKDLHAEEAKEASRETQTPRKRRKKGSVKSAPSASRPKKSAPTIKRSPRKSR